MAPGLQTTPDMEKAPRYYFASGTAGACNKEE
jgi:hypothetical protein